MTNPLLAHCLAVADAVERAALELGADRGPLASLPARCAAFRAACESVATNRGLRRLTIAFVGPRNAGKTTLLTALLNDPEAAAKLPLGVRAPESTRKVIWVGPEPPAELDPATEEWLPCDPPRLEGLDTPVEFIDVPGFNDRDPAVRAAARQALDSAWVKILVVEERGLEAFATHEYLAAGDGSIILPVVNQAGAPSGPDLTAFSAELARHLPEAHLLPPVVVPDFQREGADRGAVLAEARESLAAALATAVKERAGESGWAAALAQPQLQARLRRFLAEVRQTARAALPATADALAEVDEAEAALPHRVLEGLLGEERPLLALLRGRFRALLLDNTPLLCFPWRLTLAVANLLWGALDRLPLMFLGSVPSWISAGLRAARNLRSAGELETLAREGLRTQLEEQARRVIQPKLRALHESLRVDLHADAPHPADASPTLEAEGAAALQRESTAVFQSTIEKAAPGRAFAFLNGFLGTALFWGLFIWPLGAVYLQYGEAVAAVWTRQPDAAGQFPASLLGLLASSAVLALLPMGLWLLLTVAWVTRRGRVRRCLRELRRAHEAALQRMVAEGTLLIRLADRRLAAVRRLLGTPQRGQ